MGIELVKATAATCGHLPGTPYKILTYMAANALDRANGKGQPARLYFGGWQPLALAIGRDPTSAAAAEQVRRGVRTLTDAGYVKPLGRPSPGTRQTYRLEIPGT